MSTTREKQLRKRRNIFTSHQAGTSVATIAADLGMKQTTVWEAIRREAAYRNYMARKQASGLVVGTRALNCLAMFGIFTAPDLLERWPALRTEKIPNMGSKTRAEVDAAFNRLQGD